MAESLGMTHEDARSDMINQPHAWAIVPGTFGLPWARRSRCSSLSDPLEIFSAENGGSAGRLCPFEA
jgi:hypothetical protein